MAGTFSSHWWPEEEPIYEPDMLRSEVSLEQELAGLCVLKAISRPDSGMQPLGDLDSDGRGTNVSALRVALSLAQDPTTTLHLSEPRIIYGCIKLLKTIKSQRGTIFDELGPGWLCFRLLVITLDTCLLERFDKLEETLALPNQRPNIRAAPHILVSAHLAHGIYSRFDDIAAGRCDWVFGWSISPYKPLLSASEALDLMNIIWEDRKLFLRVIYSCVATSRPGLSGLMFLFLRSIAHMKLQPNTNMRIPGARFCELAIRYLLVADKHQRVPMILMCDTETEAFISIGTHIPRHVDPEDSRVISTAFIRQLTAGDDPDILRRREPCTMLRLVPLAIDIKAQSLIPDVVGCIIEYGWFALPTIHEQSNKEPWGVIAIIFEALRMILCPSHSQPYHLEPRIQTRIIDIVHDHNLPDWTARIIILLNLQNLTITETILITIVNFYERLCSALDNRGDLEKRFLHYVPEWWKIYQYMKSTRYTLSELPEDYREPYPTKHMSTWGMVNRQLGISGQGSGIGSRLSEYQVVECFNARCALGYTSAIEGARFACGKCKLAFYCDDRCQSIDSNNHRAVCNPRTGLNTQ